MAVGQSQSHANWTSGGSGTIKYNFSSPTQSFTSNYNPAKAKEKARLNQVYQNYLKNKAPSTVNPVVKKNTPVSSQIKGSTTVKNTPTASQIAGKTSSNKSLPTDMQGYFNLAQQAMNEAKQKQEASKTSALGYYDEFASMLPQYQQQLGQNYQTSLGYYQPIADQLAGMQGDIISPEQMQRLKNERTDILSASGQNLIGAFGDADSGIQTGRRLGIAMGTANQAANIPLQTELDVGQANRASNLGLLSQRANVAGSMAGLGSQKGDDLTRLLNYYGQVASGKAGIQQNYQYDPGAGYMQAIGQAMGQQSQMANYPQGNVTGGQKITSGIGVDFKGKPTNTQEIINQSATNFNSVPAGVFKYNLPVPAQQSGFSGNLGTVYSPKTYNEGNNPYGYVYNDNAVTPNYDKLLGGSNASFQVGTNTGTYTPLYAGQVDPFANEPWGSRPEELTWSQKYLNPLNW